MKGALRAAGCARWAAVSAVGRVPLLGGIRDEGERVQPPGYIGGRGWGEFICGWSHCRLCSLPCLAATLSGARRSRLV